MKKILLCLLALLMLTACGRKPRPADTTTTTADLPETSTAFYLSIHQDYALSLVKASIKEESPVRVDHLTFSAEKGIETAGIVSIAKLSDYYSFFYPSFLPQTIDFTSSCTVSFQNDRLVLTPTEMTAGILQIPVELLPRLLYGSIEEELNRYLSTMPFPITSITVNDGSMSLQG